MCKTKAQLLIGGKLSVKDTASIAALPLGDKILTGQTTMLGLHLKGIPFNKKRNEGRGSSAHKGVIKTVQRAHKSANKKMGVQTAILNWNAYCMSCVPYGASVEGLTWRQLDTLYCARSKAIGIRGWLPAKMATGILAAIGTSPLADPATEAGGALIGTCLLYTSPSPRDS